MIYYYRDDLVIRSMLQSDIDQLVNGFSEQGWNKPREQYINYYQQQEKKEKLVVIAELNGNVAGYVTLLSKAEVGPFANKNIPEIVDFNVLIKYQKQGIGNKIMDVAESLAKETSDYVSLAVGLHSGYGSAQRMYVKRGYLPDGSGVWYHESPLAQYAKCENDDELILYLSKSLLD